MGACQICRLFAWTILVFLGSPVRFVFAASMGLPVPESSEKSDEVTDTTLKGTDGPQSKPDPSPADDDSSLSADDVTVTSHLQDFLSLRGLSTGEMEKTTEILKQVCRRITKEKDSRNLEEICEQAVRDNVLGDIAFTPQQAAELLDSLDKRKKRKMYRYSKYYWSLPIKYKFTPEHYDEAEKAQIRKGLRHWEDNTCIRFLETNYSETITENHLLFHRGGGCWSYIGSYRSPQLLSIDRGCFALGIVAHEVGHAVGFYHEQSRPDREDYIVVNEDYIDPLGLYNYRKTSNSVNKGVRYDLGSAMHYGMRFFARTGIPPKAYAVEARNPLYQYTMGWQSKLSFADTLLANLAYNCTVRSCKGTTAPVCKNNGYQDPNACSQCKCPEGLAGDCTQVKLTSGGCYGEYTATDKAQILSSPSHEQWEHGMTECNWIIKTKSTGSVLGFRFKGPFQVATYNHWACKDFVEVRVDGLTYTGARFCGSQPHIQEFESVQNKALVLYRGSRGKREGFRLEFVEDTNECALGLHNCTHSRGVCKNIIKQFHPTLKGWECACQAGYHGDGITFCQDVNECQDGSHDCHPNARCVNTDGSFKCSCFAGFTGSGRTCDDVNECGSTGICGVGRCVNTVGSYTCRCPTGYGWNTSSCADIDECVYSRCDPHAVCHNLPGSYTCQCEDGFVGNGYVCHVRQEGMCEPSNNTCDKNAICLVENGTVTCTCLEGYTGNGTLCDDVDECNATMPPQKSNDCDVNAFCLNVAGSYSCTCNDGFIGKGDVCEDIDECTGGAWRCSPRARCFNTIGSYTCSCDEGFFGDGINCTDINECMTGNPRCHDLAVCQNTAGSYRCVCREGFTGNGRFCREVNECADGSHNCSEDATCTDFYGGFNCSCSTGFSGNGVMCEDIDECASGIHNCGTHSTCTNTRGSFNCRCEPYYAGDGINCTDVNECIAGTANCDVNADCLNTEGGYTCTCREPFQGNGTVCVDGCKDISCRFNQICLLTPTGVAQCACAPGYHFGKGDFEDFCVDANECHTQPFPCSVFGECINTWGSYYCRCRDGFNGDGRNCTDMDECRLNQTTCHPLAFCQNTLGSFTCRCRHGYYGDGFTWCAPGIDPCVSTPCPLIFDCLANQDGGYSCECPPGYEVGTGKKWRGLCVPILPNERRGNRSRLRT